MSSLAPYAFIFDLETTGLSRVKRTVPIQIAGILVDKNLNEVARFGPYFIKPPADANLEEYAMNMHAARGWTIDYLNTVGLDPVDVYARLRDFLAPYGKVYGGGQNVGRYDFPILEREYELALGAGLPMDYHGGLDTAAMAIERFIFGDGSLTKPSLEPLCARLGVFYSKTEGHTAMHDAEASLRCLRALMFGAYPSKEGV